MTTDKQKDNWKLKRDLVIISGWNPLMENDFSLPIPAFPDRAVQRMPIALDAFQGDMVGCRHGIRRQYSMIKSAISQPETAEIYLNIDID